MRFRARRVRVVDRASIDELLAESEQLDRQLRRMVRRLETFTDHLLVATVDPADGSRGGAF